MASRSEAASRPEAFLVALAAAVLVDRAAAVRVEVNSLLVDRTREAAESNHRRRIRSVHVPASVTSATGPHETVSAL